MKCWFEKNRWFLHLKYGSVVACMIYTSHRHCERSNLLHYVRQGEERSHLPNLRRLLRFARNDVSDHRSNKTRLKT